MSGTIAFVARFFMILVNKNKTIIIKPIKYLSSESQNSTSRTVIYIVSYSYCYIELTFLMAADYILCIDIVVIIH